jgi:asparagine synthase (glutamine-hydrolysing)
MPLHNEREDRTLIFSGEEYPDPDTASGLIRRGHTLDAKEAGYLIHVSEEDAAFPKSLNGRFHGLLVCPAAGTAMLFNDRFGMHRLYYHEAPDAFYFAAEAKAILSAIPELRNADARGLSEFISFGCVLENRTLFRDVFALPPGSAWSFRNGEIEKKASYFQPLEWENQGPLDPESYYRELERVFSKNLPRYFRGREKAAVSLTGGLDTRMIMAWHEAAPDSLPMYTFGGPIRECEDVTIARKVARICKQPYQVIPVGGEFLSRFAHYAERAVYLSDGCAGVHRSADLYANEIAGQIAPIRVTGNYGSEILRRLRAFKPSEPAQGLFHPDLLDHVDEAKRTFSQISQGHAVSFTAFRQAPWYQYGVLSLEQTQLSPRSPFLDNDLVAIAFRSPKSAIVNRDIFEDDDDCARLIAAGSEELHSIPTDRGLGGAQRWSSGISRAMLEFTFKAEYAYDYGMPQWLAEFDHTFSWLHLERLFLGRHKFCHFRTWYRDELASYVEGILLDPVSLSRPYINSRRVEAIVQGHLKGNRNYTTEIHKLLTLELLHRLFLDSQSA